MLKKFILSILLLLFITSCATMIKVKLLKPSDIDIGGIQKVAVLDINTDNNNANCSSSTLTSKLIDKIIDNGHFTVLGNTRQSEIMSGGFWIFVKGQIDNEKIKELGNRLGIDAIIVSDVSCVSKDEKTWKEDTDEINDVVLPVKKFRIERDINVTMDYKVIETTYGRILGSKELTDNSKTYSSYYTGQILQNGTYIMLGIDEDEKKASSELANISSTLENLNNSILDKIVNQIAPHFEVEEREIKSGDSDLMKQAIELSKNNFLDKARVLWEEVLNTPAFNKDHIPAMYNLGIYYEVKGNFEKSEDYFMQCFARTNDKQYLEDISRIKQRKEDIRKLKAQGKDTNY